MYEYRYSPVHMSLHLLLDYDPTTDGKADKAGSSIGGTLLNMLRHGFGYGPTSDAAEPAPAADSPASPSTSVDTPRGAQAADEVDWSMAIEVKVADPFYWSEGAATHQASPQADSLPDDASTPFYWSHDPTTKVGAVIDCNNAACAGSGADAPLWAGPAHF